MHADQGALPQVCQQDLDNAQWQVEARGQIGHRRREPAQAQ
jgi:hypothetical protein